MLAERLPSILPELDDEAALEVTALHSIAGLLPPGGRLLRRPPFQAPHHTATVPSLVGGGSRAGPARRGVAGPPRGAVPRRGPRVQQGRAGGAAPAAGERPRPAEPQRRRHRVPGPDPAGAGRQPVPVREAGRRRALRVHAAGPPPLPGPALRAAARPDRRTGAADAGAGGGADGDPTATPSRRRRSPPGWRRPGRRRPAAGPGSAGALNAEVDGPHLRRPPWRLPARVTARAAGPARLRLAVGARLRPGHPDGLDHR